MVDFRQAMHNILDEYGQYILLIRRNEYQTCKCVTAAAKAPRDDCPVCLGTGTVNKAERVLARVKATNSNDTLPKVTQSTPIGDVGVIFRQFYVDFRVRPRSDDLFVICDWKSDKPYVPIITQYTAIYEINYVEPLRGEKGRIEYFMSVTKSDPVNVDVKLHNIVQNASRYDYYVTVRDNDV
jgi:DnaJ-class molecular chaperone